MFKNSGSKLKILALRRVHLMFQKSAIQLKILPLRRVHLIFKKSGSQLKILALRKMHLMFETSGRQLKILAHRRVLVMFQESGSQLKILPLRRVTCSKLHTNTTRRCTSIPHLEHPEKQMSKDLQLHVLMEGEVRVVGVSSSKMRLVCVSYKEFQQHVLFVLFIGGYQPQPSNKQLHTEHTPLRNIILH